MRSTILLTVLVCLSSLAYTQSTSFPQNWEGEWKGELQWFKTGSPAPQKVNMELKIHPGDSTGIWDWQIIYGSENDDDRAYKLIPKDTAGIHWVIDELNGIVLDQYWVANKFCGAFTVQSSTIINSYWMENDKLIVEFYSISSKPVATTGAGTAESPFVDSYKMGSYQKAVLSQVR
jgi:hypothetical protein